MSAKRYYDPRRGGHAPGHLRDAFLEEVLERYVERHEPLPETVEVDEEPKPLRWLLGQLWNCTDIVPNYDRDILDMTGSDTYAAAVRMVAAMLEQ